MTDKQQKANIVCCETCSHREVCYDVITNTDYDFKGYGCLRYCVSPLVISNNASKETATEILKWLVNTGVINTAPNTTKMYFKEHFGVEVDE